MRKCAVPRRPAPLPTERLLTRGLHLLVLRRAGHVAPLPHSQKLQNPRPTVRLLRDWDQAHVPRLQLNKLDTAQHGRRVEVLRLLEWTHAHFAMAQDTFPLKHPRTMLL